MVVFEQQDSRGQRLFYAIGVLDGFPLWLLRLVRSLVARHNLMTAHPAMYTLGWRAAYVMMGPITPMMGPTTALTQYMT